MKLQDLLNDEFVVQKIAKIMFIDSIIISGCKRKNSSSVWENSSLEVKRKWVARSHNAIFELLKIAKERGIE